MNKKLNLVKAPEDEINGAVKNVKSKAERALQSLQHLLPPQSIVKMRSNLNQVVWPVS
jgi:hypothetical protein